MKCPKCGFTSFDYLDSCKKCGGALTEFKARHGLRSVLFPGRSSAPPKLAPAPAPAPLPIAHLSSTASPMAPQVAVEPQDASDFGFDFLEVPPQDSDRTVPTLDDLLLAESVEAAPTAPAAIGMFPATADFVLDPGAIDRDEETALDEEDLFDLGGTAEELPPLEIAGECNFDVSDALSEPEKRNEPRTAPPPGKPSGPEGPSDPFEHRGPAMAGQIPETASGRQPHTGTRGREESPLDSLLDSFENAGSLPRFEANPAFESLPRIDLAAILEIPPLPLPMPPFGVVQKKRASDNAGAPRFTVPGLDQEPPSGPAPLVHRLAAFLADGLLLGAVFFAFLVIGERLLFPGRATSLLPATDTLLRLYVPYFLILFVLCFGYFTMFHSFLGQTPGKMLFNLVVEGLDNSPLNLAQAFLRSVGGLASLCLGGVGYLVILFYRDGRGWNDRLAGSRVVISNRKESN